MNATIMGVRDNPIHVIVNDEESGVQIEAEAETGCAYMTFRPDRARELAAALLRAADEAEWDASGGVPRRLVKSTAHLTPEDRQAATRRLADRLHHSRPENQEEGE